MEAKALVEAALFVADRPLSLARLAEVAGLSEEAVGRLIQALADECSASDRGVELVNEGGGYVLRVKAELASAVRSFAPHQDIPEQTLRTLAVIAYQAPVLQSQVVKMRGQRAYGQIGELVARGFVEAEVQGPTKVLTVTPALLAYFGASSLDELRAQLGPSGSLCGNTGPGLPMSRNPSLPQPSPARGRESDRDAGWSASPCPLPPLGGRGEGEGGRL